MGEGERVSLTVFAIRAHDRLWRLKQVKIYTDKSDSDMYKTCHELILAYMGMQKAILYNTCVII